MKKIITLSLAFSALVFTTNAQEKREIKKDSKERMERHEGMREDRKEMIAELNLTDAQKAQMKSNRQAFKTQMDQLKAQDLPAGLFNERKKALLNDQKMKMESILTAEQKAKMQERKKNDNGHEGKKEKFKNKNKEAKHYEKMKEKLGLSNDQAAKLAAQHQAIKERKEVIKKDLTLSKDARKSKMMALKNEAKEQRKTILTADQLKKMEEFKRDHKDKNPTKARK